MNIFIVLFSSILVLILLRIIFIGLYFVLSKIFKANNNMKFDLGLSIFFLLGYIQALLGAMQGVSNVNELSNLEWYILYTFIGISMMLWCYFNWDFQFKSIPKLAINKKQMTIKKIIVFILVMLFSFYYGYKTLDKAVIGEEIDLLITITNATIIPGIIAFDRVLNQIISLRNSQWNVLGK